MGYFLVIGGIAVHIIFLYSIFDIYFTSPLVHGMTPFHTHMDPPAKRLVFFVADGLRADKLLELDDNGLSRAPYLREIIEKRGGWGVSHTRVPTESRPGHVALIAGFYEDVSAVAKGWKENPVEFDSLFNQSRYTWSWGSPDILPMFVSGTNKDHVFTHTYPAESEDFAGSDLYQLDTWVFDRVKEFIETSATDNELHKKVNKDKIVFFLHLLGIDTNGHAHKPMSEEYLNNIRIMDAGVKSTVELIEKHYNYDGRTAYILTADHGMTNWGSHGAGDPHETLTPLVAWGAGLRTPLPGSIGDCPDSYSSDWGLCGQIKRSDVNQADIAPLMASLIGVPWPINSVGVLPLDYLNNTLQYKAESLFSNAKQIVAQYEVKMIEKKRTTLSAVFRPFTKLSLSSQADKLRKIKLLLSEEKYDAAIEETSAIIDLALEGLSYYHSYDRFFLGLSVTTGFLGWMSYILTLVIDEHTHLVDKSTRISSGGTTRNKLITIGFYCLRVVIVFLLYVQTLPWTYYIYCLLPTVLWEKVAQRRYIFNCLWVVVNQRRTLTIFLCVISVIGLEIIAMSFFHRQLLSIGLVAMALWPLFYTQWNQHKAAVLGWVLSCLVMAAFPLLPVVGRKANYSLVTLAGCIAIILAVWCVRRPECHMLILGKRKRSRQVLGLTLAQIFILCISVCLVQSTSINISAKDGLPQINQYLSWFILCISICLPLFSESRVLTRLLNIVLSLLAPYLLLSTSHEGLFYVALSCLLFFWLWLEHSFTRKTHKLEDADFTESNSLFDEERHLVLADLRCCYIFIYLINTAFFGTGNIASINSFDPSTVYCFLTIFNPFIMGALMLLKILIPFILVTCVFNAIHVTVRVPTKSLFLIVLLMSDFMGLHFFFLVQDSGSWLEIGTSISHYVIVMSMITFIFILLGVANILTTFRIRLKKTHDH